MHQKLRVTVALGVATVLSACGSLSHKAAKPDLSSPAPYAIPPSKYGNPETYEVFGREYQVLTSSEGYRQRGIASWYGPKFHGKRTSSGKTYDMHQLTAAHKTLPIPTFVQVSRLDTGQSIVVEVNDRGPFVDDRLIDLSYAAATKLDMVGAGTAPVEVKALPPYQYLARHKGQPRESYHPAQPLVATVQPSGARDKAEHPSQALNQFAQPIANTLPSPAQPASFTPYPSRPDNKLLAENPAPEPSTGVYLQVGAFSLKSRAEQLQSFLSQSLAKPVVLEAGTGELHRVKIGPLQDPQDIAQLRLALADLGISNSYLVAQAGNNNQK